MNWFIYYIWEPFSSMFKWMDRWNKIRTDFYLLQLFFFVNVGVANFLIKNEKHEKSQIWMKYPSLYIYIYIFKHRIKKQVVIWMIMMMIRCLVTPILIIGKTFIFIVSFSSLWISQDCSKSHHKFDFTFKVFASNNTLSIV